MRIYILTNQLSRRFDNIIVYSRLHKSRWRRILSAHFRMNEQKASDASTPKRCTEVVATSAAAAVVSSSSK